MLKYLAEIRFQVIRQLGLRRNVLKPIGFDIAEKECLLHDLCILHEKQHIDWNNLDKFEENLKRAWSRSPNYLILHRMFS